MRKILVTVLLFFGITALQAQSLKGKIKSSDGSPIEAVTISIFFWGQNLTNEKYLLYGPSDTSFGRTVLMASPSTFGVTFSAKF